MGFRVSHNPKAWPVIYHGNGPSKKNPIFKDLVEKIQNQYGCKEDRPIDADITVLTWSIPEETTMLEECFDKMGIKGELIVIPLSKPINWLDKIKKTKEYLKKIDTKYVMGLDSTDILISTDKRGQKTLWYDIIKTFRSLNCKLLFNAEKYNWPSSDGRGCNIKDIDSMNGYLLAELIKTEKFEEKMYRDFLGSKFFRLNSGAFIGYTDYTKEFYQTLCDEHVDRFYANGTNEGLFGGDQGFIRIMQTKCFPDLTIDYRNKIFLAFAGIEKEDIAGVWQ